VAKKKKEKKKKLSHFETAVMVKPVLNKVDKFISKVAFQRGEFKFEGYPDISFVFDSCSRRGSGNSVTHK